MASASIIGTTAATGVEPGTAREGRPPRGHPRRPAAHEEHALDSADALDRFLASVERRAFRIAELATGDADEALDIVQEAMLGLARRYAHRPPEEWRVLFHRILDSRIRDWHRRRAVRRRLLGWLERPRAEDPDDPPGDPLERVPDTGAGPDAAAARDQALAAVARALRALPHRQRQAFLLRAWEGLDVRETAAAMGCSEGSVKTHYSRAVHALRRMLESGT